MDPEAQCAGNSIGECGAEHERAHGLATEFALGSVLALRDLASQPLHDV